METISGEVQNIKGNNFVIEGIWYNNQFKKLPNGFKKGINVEVTYLTKNNRNFWKDIIIDEIKPAYVEDDVITQDLEIKKEIPNQTVNTILMNIKDILIQEISEGHTFTPEELITKSEILTKMFLQDYKIINSLA